MVDYLRRSARELPRLSPPPSLPGLSFIFFSLLPILLFKPCRPPSPHLFIFYTPLLA